MIPIIIQNIENSDDRDFMEKLYVNYNRLIYSAIIKITNDHWATEDILQTVIVKLIDKIPLLQTLTKTKLINYIISTAKNSALNYLRSKNRAIEVDFETVIDYYDDTISTIDEKLMLSDMLKNVNAAWQFLDDRSKQLLELKYVLEKSNAEISEELGIKKDSVRMYLTRARNSLKEKINDTEMV